MSSQTAWNRVRVFVVNKQLNHHRFKTFLSITQIKWIRKHQPKKKYNSQHRWCVHFHFILFLCALHHVHVLLFWFFSSFFNQQVAFWTHTTHTCIGQTVWMKSELKTIKTFLSFALTSTKECRLGFVLVLITWSDNQQSQRSVIAIHFSTWIREFFNTQIAADNENVAERVLACKFLKLYIALLTRVATAKCSWLFWVFPFWYFAVYSF